MAIFVRALRIGSRYCAYCDLRESEHSCSFFPAKLEAVANEASKDRRGNTYPRRKPTTSGATSYRRQYLSLAPIS